MAPTASAGADANQQRLWQQSEARTRSVCRAPARREGLQKQASALACAQRRIARLDRRQTERRPGAGRRAAARAVADDDDALDWRVRVLSLSRNKFSSDIDRNVLYRKFFHASVLAPIDCFVIKFPLIWILLAVILL